MKLEIDIGAKINALKAGLSAAGSAASATASHIKNAFSTQLSDLGGMIAGYLSFKGLAGGSKELLGALDNIDKASQRVGVSASEFQKLKYAAEQSGAGMETLEKSITKMEQKIDESSSGNESATATFHRLGLSVEELARMNPSQQFSAISAAIAKVEDPTQRAAIAMDIFGKTGTKLLPMVGDLESLKQEAADLGLVIDDKTVAAAVRAGDAFQTFGTKMLATLASSGVTEKLLAIAEGLLAISTNAEKAAAAGLFNRKQAVEMSINKAEKSGKYTPEEITAAKKSAGAYGEGQNSGRMTESAYGNIDKMMSENGFNDLARVHKPSGWFDTSDQFSGVTLSTRSKTPSEYRAELAAKKAAEEEAARQKAEMARKAKEDKFNAANNIVTGSVKDQVKTLNEKVASQTLNNSGSQREAFIQEQINTARKKYDTVMKGKSFNPEERAKLDEGQQQGEKQIAAAAGQLYDSKMSGSVKERIAGQEQQIALQEMINAGLQREAYILGQINDAEKQGTITAEQKQQIAETAARSYDSNLATVIRSRLADVQQQITVQEMVNTGKKREAFIQKEINDAAKDGKISDSQRQQVADSAGALYDAQKGLPTAGRASALSAAESIQMTALQKVGGNLEAANMPTVAARVGAVDISAAAGKIGAVNMPGSSDASAGGMKTGVDRIAQSVAKISERLDRMPTATGGNLAR